MLMFTYVVVAVTTDTASASCKECFNHVTRDIARTAWTTFETAMRGFLLGFGGAILKDAILKDKDTEDVEKAFKKTLTYAKIVGLGSASFMVGIAIFMPARWRYELITLK